MLNTQNVASANSSNIIVEDEDDEVTLMDFKM